MTTSDPVKCWIDEQGIVWSHDCEGKATPAVAVPESVYNEVRRELEWLSEIPDGVVAALAIRVLHQLPEIPQ